MPGALFLALLGQAALAYFALSVVPGVQLDSFLAALWASWIVAGVATLASWLMTAGTNDAVFARLVRGARRGEPVPDPDVTGMLFVQLDGVPFPVLQWGIMGGTLPTLSRWIRGGSHEFMEWTPTLPATTPASQMGILHGTTDGRPASVGSIVPPDGSSSPTSRQTRWTSRRCTPTGEGSLPTVACR